MKTCKFCKHKYIFEDSCPHCVDAKKIVKAAIEKACVRGGIIRRDIKRELYERLGL